MMILVKTKGFGMRSNKFLPIACSIVFLFVGCALGYYIKNVPLLEFDSKIGISAILSILGLIVTIFIMPFIINDKKNREEKINDAALRDLDLICEEIEKIRSRYESFLGKEKMTDVNKAEILRVFKRVSSLMYALSDQFKRYGVLKDFKENIIANSYTPAYEACTDKLMANPGLSDIEIKEALAKLDGFYNTVKKTRYELYD